MKYQSRLVYNAQKLGYDPLKAIKTYTKYEIEISGFPNKEINEKHKEAAYQRTMKELLVQYNIDNK